MRPNLKAKASELKVTGDETDENSVAAKEVNLDTLSVAPSAMAMTDLGGQLSTKRLSKRSKTKLPYRIHDDPKLVE